MAEQQIHFCSARDGTRIAYATSGRGSPVVRVGHWLTHVERDWQSPVRRPWLDTLGSANTLIRYDIRGMGLSDRDCAEVSFDAWVSDLEAVVDDLGLERFALFGACQSAALAITYAVRHPERVSRLVLYGAYQRGWLCPEQPEQVRIGAEAMITLTRIGWGTGNRAVRQMWTCRFLPDATLEQIRHFDELQRVSATGESAARAVRVMLEIDVTALAPLVRVPTLILHARGDELIEFEEGLQVAGLLPGAVFVPLDSRNHLLQGDEPAWKVFSAEVQAFLEHDRPAGGDHVVGATSGGAANGTPVGAVDGLTLREREVLTLVARGASNDEIARQLCLSARTVERHLSNAYAKLGLNGRSARVAAATRLARLGVEGRP